MNNEVSMTVELRKIHLQNDRAVMEVYGLPWRTTVESQRVSHLLTLYRHLSQGQGG